jgi:hypothetical protein
VQLAFYYLFDWYQREQKQKIESDVVERIWYEFKGQPGLTCWFGELLTETYNTAPSQPITMALFEGVYATALNLSFRRVMEKLTYCSVMRGKYLAWN